MNKRKFAKIIQKSVKHHITALRNYDGFLDGITLKNWNEKFFFKDNFSILNRFWITIHHNHTKNSLLNYFYKKLSKQKPKRN